jgi:hypothetical protein
MNVKRAAVLLMCAPLLAAAADTLPARNLLVEWRVSAAATDQRDSGAIVLRSDGSGTRAGVSVDTRSGERSRDGVQRVLVLNGASATLRLTQAVPWQFVQAAWDRGPASSPRGQGVALGTQWIESGQGLQVQPRWPGGAAPVTVELHAESAAPSADGSAAREQLHATLQLPMNQWVAVAQRSVDPRQTLQLRISTP